MLDINLEKYVILICFTFKYTTFHLTYRVFLDTATCIGTKKSQTFSNHQF